MSENSKIQWTTHTWNPTTGCTQIPGVGGSPSGCDKCYAKRQLDTRFRANPKSPRFGLPFETVLTHPNRLATPEKWKSPALIFVNSVSDLFHADIPEAFIDEVFATMLHDANWHTYQILTKRPERMQRYMRSFSGPAIPPNVWLGTSISTNADAWRSTMLAKTNAAIRFLSVEPMLGPVNDVPLVGIDWVIAGGESGPGARPMHEVWVRELRDRCERAGIAFFFKQWGAWVPANGSHDASHLFHECGDRLVPKADASRDILSSRGNPIGTEDLVDRGHPGWTRIRKQQNAEPILNGRRHLAFPTEAAAKIAATNKGVAR